jgi:hypothetical protein
MLLRLCFTFHSYFCAFLNGACGEWTGEDGLKQESFLECLVGVVIYIVCVLTFIPFINGNNGEYTNTDDMTDLRKTWLVEPPLEKIRKRFFCELWREKRLKYKNKRPPALKVEFGERETENTHIESKWCIFIPETYPIQFGSLSIETLEHVKDLDEDEEEDPDLPHLGPSDQEVTCSICMNALTIGLKRLMVTPGPCGHVMCLRCTVKLQRCPFCNRPYYNPVYLRNIGDDNLIPIPPHIDDPLDPRPYESDESDEEYGEEREVDSDLESLDAYFLRHEIFPRWEVYGNVHFLNLPAGHLSTRWFHFQLRGDSVSFWQEENRIVALVNRGHLLEMDTDEDDYAQARAHGFLTDQEYLIRREIAIGLSRSAPTRNLSVRTRNRVATWMRENSTTATRQDDADRRRHQLNGRNGEATNSDDMENDQEKVDNVPILVVPPSTVDAREPTDEEKWEIVGKRPKNKLAEKLAEEVPERQVESKPTSTPVGRPDRESYKPLLSRVVRHVRSASIPVGILDWKTYASVLSRRDIPVLKVGCPMLKKRCVGQSSSGAQKPPQKKPTKTQKKVGSPMKSPQEESKFGVENREVRRGKGKEITFLYKVKPSPEEQEEKERGGRKAKVANFHNVTPAVKNEESESTVESPKRCVRESFSGRTKGKEVVNFHKVAPAVKVEEKDEHAYDAFFQDMRDVSMSRDLAETVEDEGVMMTVFFNLKTKKANLGGYHKDGRVLCVYPILSKHSDSPPIMVPKNRGLSILSKHGIYGQAESIDVDNEEDLEDDFFKDNSFFPIFTKKEEPKIKKTSKQTGSTSADLPVPGLPTDGDSVPIFSEVDFIPRDVMSEPQGSLLGDVPLDLLPRAIWVRCKNDLEILIKENGLMRSDYIESKQEICLEINVYPDDLPSLLLTDKGRTSLLDHHYHVHNAILQVVRAKYQRLVNGDSKELRRRAHAVYEKCGILNLSGIYWDIKYEKIQINLRKLPIHITNAERMLGSMMAWTVNKLLGGSVLIIRTYQPLPRKALKKGRVIKTNVQRDVQVGEIDPTGEHVVLSRVLEEQTCEEEAKSEIVARWDRQKLMWEMLDKTTQEIYGVQDYTLFPGTYRLYHTYLTGKPSGDDVGLKIETNREFSDMIVHPLEWQLCDTSLYRNLAHVFRKLWETIKLKSAFLRPVGIRKYELFGDCFPMGALGEFYEKNISGPVFGNIAILASVITSEDISATVTRMIANALVKEEVNAPQAMFMHINYTCNETRKVVEAIRKGVELREPKDNDKEGEVSLFKYLSAAASVCYLVSVVPFLLSCC